MVETATTKAFEMQHCDDTKCVDQHNANCLICSHMLPCKLADLLTPAKLLICSHLHAPLQACRSAHTCGNANLLICSHLHPCKLADLHNNTSSNIAHLLICTHLRKIMNLLSNINTNTCGNANLLICSHLWRCKLADHAHVIWAISVFAMENGTST